MRPSCACARTDHTPKLVVVTGGPGAGKTAVLEMIRRSFCEHVVVLPEAASIVFGGGFPRRATMPARRAAQRAIYRIQRELERLAIEEGGAAVVLCDRGTLDGLAYWSDGAASFFEENETTPARELERYAAVIQLRTPLVDGGYNHSNPLRVESAREAAAIDDRIAVAWRDHPRRSFVENAPDFIEKAARTIELVRNELPACCASHRVSELVAAGAPAGRDVKR